MKRRTPQQRKRSKKRLLSHLRDKYAKTYKEGVISMDAFEQQEKDLRAILKLKYGRHYNLPPFDF